MEKKYIIIINGQIQKEVQSSYDVIHMRQFLSGFYPYAEFGSYYVLGDKSVVMCYRTDTPLDTPHTHQ